MTLRALTSAVLFHLAVAAFPQAASAQGLGVAVGAGFFAFNGDDLQNLEGGFGLEGRLSYAVSHTLSLGFAVTRVSSDIVAVDENAITTIVSVEPRLTFVQRTGNVTPFVGGRIGYAHQSLDVEGTVVSASGLGLGGVAGLAIGLSPSISLEIAGALTALSFGDVRADGDSFAGTDRKGSLLGLSGGLSISFGRTR